MCYGKQDTESHSLIATVTALLLLYQAASSLNGYHHSCCCCCCCCYNCWLDSYSCLVGITMAESQLKVPR